MGWFSTEEASRQDSVQPERSRAKGLVLDQGSGQVGHRQTVAKAHEGICPRHRKQAGGTLSDRNGGARKGMSPTGEASKRNFCPTGMKARGWAYPRPWKQAGGATSDWNEGARNGLFSTVVASRRDFVLSERRHAKGLVLDRASKLVRHRPTGMKARERDCS